MSLTRIASTDTVSTLEVDPLGHDLEVGGIDARAVPTKVVDLESGRDGSASEFVDEPMRLEQPFTPTTSRHHPITIRESSGPQPAPWSVRHLDVLPEAFLSRSHRPIVTEYTEAS